MEVLETLPELRSLVTSIEKSCTHLYTVHERFITYRYRDDFHGLWNCQPSSACLKAARRNRRFRVYSQRFPICKIVRSGIDSGVAMQCLAPI